MRPGAPRRHPVPAPGLVLGAIASVQVGGALAKRLFAEAGPGGTVLLRLLFAAVVLTALVRPRLRGHDPRRLHAAVVFGLVLAGMNLSFYEAVARIPLGVTVTIEFLGPLAVAVFGSRRLLDFGWVVLAALGVAALTVGGGSVSVPGVALALVAAACWAAYIVLNQRVGRLFPGGTGLTFAMIVGAVAVAPYGVVDGGSALLRPDVLAAGCAVGLLSSAIPYSLELAALRRLRAAAFGVLMSLEPAMAALAGFIILREALHPRQLIGIALVSAASAGVTLAGRAGIPPEPGTAELQPEPGRRS